MKNEAKWTADGKCVICGKAEPKVGNRGSHRRSCLKKNSARLADLRDGDPAPGVPVAASALSAYRDEPGTPSGEPLPAPEAAPKCDGCGRSASLVVNGHPVCQGCVDLPSEDGEESKVEALPAPTLAELVPASKAAPSKAPKKAAPKAKKTPKAEPEAREFVPAVKGHLGKRELGGSPARVAKRELILSVLAEAGRPLSLAEVTAAVVGKNYKEPGEAGVYVGLRELFSSSAVTHESGGKRRWAAVAK